MIKLTKNQLNELDATVRVEGRLDAESVRELENFLAAMGAAERITLDLSGLASVDHNGLSALVTLQSAGRRFVGASLYIHQLLEEAQP